jgi:hypothetical protein
MEGNELVKLRRDWIGEADFRFVDCALAGSKSYLIYHYRCGLVLCLLRKTQEGYRFQRIQRWYPYCRKFRRVSAECNL